MWSWERRVGERETVLSEEVIEVLAVSIHSILYFNLPNNFVQLVYTILSVSILHRLAIRFLHSNITSYLPRPLKFKKEKKRQVEKG